MKRLLFLLVLVALGYAGWTQRGRVLSLLGREPTNAAIEEIHASPALAQIAEAKLENLKAGHSQTVSLSQDELQSLLQYKFRQLLPAFVTSPVIELDGDRIKVSGMVPVENLPSLGELGDAAAFLPDTTEVSITGTLLPLNGGRVAIGIDQVSAARIPLPDRLVPRVLQRLGRKDEPGLPRDALAVPLPPGVAAAYVRSDSLVLLARPASTSRN
ncbi:MAG: hypothetical protein WEE89_00605 [Gemmatimonadota bacterium]